MRLPVLRHKFRRFHIVRFPIEIENLIVGPKKILGVPMAIEAPGHAMRLGQIDRRHMVDGAVATETTNAADHQFDRYPVGPAWKKVGHGISRSMWLRGLPRPPQRINVEIEMRCVQTVQRVKVSSSPEGKPRFYKSVQR